MVKSKEIEEDKKSNNFIFWIFIIITIIIILYFIIFKSDGRALKVLKDTFENELSEDSSDESGYESESDEVEIKKSTKKWKREEICRNILESIYKIPFTSCRPDFLKNPKTNRNLELDGYNAELSIAFEHNGHQHYEYPNVFHRTEEDFIYQLEKDELKKQICEELEIYLIIIKHDIPENKIRSHIISELSKNPY